MTAGPKGPVLVQDFVFNDEMAHFDRERIPERVVHAKGAGQRSNKFHQMQIKFISCLYSYDQYGFLNLINILLCNKYI